MFLFLTKFVLLHRGFIMKKLICLAVVIALVFTFQNRTLVAQEKEKKDSTICSNENYLKLPLLGSFSFSYSKRGNPWNYSSVNAFTQDGNNFYGLSLLEGYYLSKRFAVALEVNMQLGNIYGNFSTYISFVPMIYLGGSFIHAYIGAGYCGLGVKHDQADLGGIGIASKLGAGVTIYKHFGIDFNSGIETYAHTSYYTFGLGLTYKLPKCLK
jgi:hypothetical protein